MKHLLTNRHTYIYLMEDDFELPVTYKGKDHHFTARLLKYGYSYKIEVEVNGTPVRFDRDEERNWRAIIEPDAMDKKSVPEAGLLAAIAEVLEDVT